MYINMLGYVQIAFMSKKTDSDFQDLLTYLLLLNIHKRLSVTKTGISMPIF